MSSQDRQAVLAKNYDNLLVEACALTRSEGPEHVVAFRSQVAWKGARKLVAAQGATTIYFRTGEGDVITYEGALIEITTGDELEPRGRELVDLYALASTKAEAWGKLQTVYVVRGLRQVLPSPIESFLRPDGTPAAKGMFTYTTVMERPPLPADAALPEEVSSDIEGLGKTITVNVYERSSQARRECLQAHGTSCSVCGFSFGNRSRKFLTLAARGS